MDLFVFEITPWFQWLIRSTFHASVIICLVIAVKALLSAKLTPRWHYYIWMVLIARMLMPIAPQSTVSIFNLIPQATKLSQPVEPAPAPANYETASTARTAIEPVVTQHTPTAPTDEHSAAFAPIEQTAAPTPATATPIPPTVSRLETFDYKTLLPFAWLIGALALAIYVYISNVRLWRIVRRQRPVTDSGVLNLLEDCKARMRIHTYLSVVETDKVTSPALFGFIRPRLLLPKGILEKLTLEQLGHVFMHELAHLKRGDIYLGWVMAFLQTLHWFNPLVWIAFHKMRADRELACDQLALASIQNEESNEYGRTMVNLLENFSAPKYNPGLAGILEERSQLKRRITMIAKHKKGSYRFSAIAAVVMILLSAIVLTNAKDKTDKPVEQTKETRNSNFTATLDNGVTVELVGVCQDPVKDGQWWNSDGQVIAKPEFEPRDKQSFKHPLLGYLLRFGPHKDVAYRSSINMDGAFNRSGPVTKRGQSVVFWGENSDPRYIRPETIDITVEVAGGPWTLNKPGRNDVYPEFTNLRNGQIILVSGLRKNPEKNAWCPALIEATTNNSSMNIALECITKDGKKLKSWHEETLTSKNNMIQYGFGFRAAVEDIEKIYVKYRPFHKTVFKNVPLKPEDKTVVPVEPKLEFLSWYKTDTDRCWQADGTVVSDAEDLRILKNLPHPGCGDPSHPDYDWLKLAFSHPLFDENSCIGLRMIGDTGKQRKFLSVTASNAKKPESDNGNRGWVMYTVSLGAKTDFPQEGNFELDYAIGNWKTEIKKMQKDYNGIMTFGSGFLLGGIGQNSESKTTISYTHKKTKTSHQQHRFVAVTQDGILEPSGQTQGGYPDMFKNEYEFDVPLKDIKYFQFQTRKVKTKIFKSVSLRPGIKPAVLVKGGYVWGQEHNGLRIGISQVKPLKQNANDKPGFNVALENVGKKDVVLNLGMMLANGKEQYTTAVKLIFTDMNGKSYEFHNNIGRHPGIAGRVDPLLVPLAVGQSYSLRVNFDNYWIIPTGTSLPPGRYEVVAMFDGKALKFKDTGLYTEDLYWTGLIKSKGISQSINNLITPDKPDQAIDPKEAAKMMDPLRELFIMSSIFLTKQDKPQKALALLEEALQQLDIINASIKGTAAEVPIGSTIHEIKPIIDSIETGRIESAKELMRSNFESILIGLHEQDFIKRTAIKIPDKNIKPDEGKQPGTSNSRPVGTRNANVQTKSIPLSLELDFDHYNPTVTSLYLKCNMIEYENIIAKNIFATTDDPQTLMYRDLLNAFRNKDAKRALEMTCSPRDEKKVTGYVEALSETFSSKMVGENFEKLYIPRQLLVGDDRVIIKAFRFDWNEKNVLYSSFTRFKGDSEPKLWDYWVKDKYTTSDLYTLVAKTDIVHISKPKKVKALDNIKTDYEILLPFSTPENPVYLQFNGKVYNDFNVLNDTAGKNDEVLKYYQKTFRLFENKEYEKFANCHTKKSKAKFLEKLKKSGPRPDKKERIVQFILNADPLFIVFFKDRHGYYYRDHEYIIRSGKKDFKLTHIGFGGQFEDLIRNKKFFREHVLDPIIAK